MKSEADAILRALLHDHGPGLCQDPRRCEALLRDHCPDCKREIFVLMGALRCGVVAELLATSIKLPPPLLMTRWAARLEQDLAMTPEAARWGVACWAAALERVAPADPTTGHAATAPVRRPGAPPLPPTTQRRARRGWHPEQAEAWVFATYLVGGLALAYGAFILFGQSGADPQTTLPATLAPLSPRDPPVPFQVPNLVDIPGGCFTMGSPAQEPGRDYDERSHRVCVAGFRLGAYEVTQAQWQAVMGQLPAENPRCDDCPVAGITWSAANRYITKLKAATGQAFRLPTEAEWEYAARAGSTTAWPWGTDPGQICRYANVADAAMARAWQGPPFYWPGHEHPCDDGIAAAVAPGGHYQPNDWGLFDLLGNVAEWTCSQREYAYDGSEQQCVPTDYAGQVALRGGSAWSNQEYTRTASRAWRHTHSPYVHGVGLRLAVGPVTPDQTLHPAVPARVRRATAKALEDQLRCFGPPQPGKAIRAMLTNRILIESEHGGGDGVALLEAQTDLRLFGRRLLLVSGWGMEDDGRVYAPFARVPGTPPPTFFGVTLEGGPKDLNYQPRQKGAGTGDPDLPTSSSRVIAGSLDDEADQDNSTTIICQ